MVQCREDRRGCVEAEVWAAAKEVRSDAMEGTDGQWLQSKNDSS